MTHLAPISSPPARTTPLARPLTDVIAVTSVPVRICPPKALREAARASATAPGPPFANTVWPGAPPSLPAESVSSTAVVPADHGPIAVYWMPRDAISARSGSDSNASATKSATAMGRTRKAVLAQPQVSNDRRPKPPDRVRRDRPAEAGGDLAGLGRPTNVVPPLEDECSETGPGKVGRGDESVVPAPDDDRVPGAARGHAARRRWLRSTSRAASRPFAPMIPPPGCVAEPHNQRSRTGLRKRA